MNEPHDRRVAGSINALLEGAAWGHYTVPKSLTDAKATEARISEELTRAHAELERLGTVETAATPLAGKLLEAARAAKPLPDVSAPLAKLEQALQLARLRVSVLRAARELAARDLYFGTEPESILVDHLRPALAEVMEEVRDLEPKLEGRSVESPEHFIRASETARVAFTSLNDLGYRYGAIRAAQQAVGRLLDGPQVDTGHKFSEFKDPQALGITIAGMAGRSQPTPEHRLTRLVWTATTGANEVWMPLPAEQDEMANAYFKAADNRRLAAFSM